MAPFSTPPSVSSQSFDISKIAGNASPELKARLGNIKPYLHGFVSPKFKDMDLFAQSAQDKLEVGEVSIVSKLEESSKLEGRVIVELDIDQEMINATGTMHGGCAAFLVDVCSSLVSSALALATEGKDYPTVSQAINMVYHSPAAVGERVRLVNTSVTMGSRTHVVRTEIWSATHHRLVASGTHVMMMPSPPKSSL